MSTAFDRITMADSILEMPSDNLVLARALILRHGCSATAYQILNPGFNLWFSQNCDAVVGYVDRGRVRVVAGSPVCATDRLAAVVNEFEKETAEVLGACVCFFAAEPLLHKSLGLQAGYSRMILGSQPVWHPNSWSGILASHSSLRAQLYRARNKSIEVQAWENRKAAAHPDIRRCLREWLADRPMPSLHFLLEPQTLERLWDRRVFVALRYGKPIGFLVATPIPARKGWLVEQIIRGREAPNGTAELLVDAAFKAAAAGGLEYFTLGLCPLSRIVRETAPQPWWLDFIFRQLRTNCRQFYDFPGLEQFKSKFKPQSWEPIYAIYTLPVVTPNLLMAMAAAFIKPIF